MNKILVFSDNHGKMDVQKIIEQNEYDYLIHCGDSCLSHDDDLMRKFSVNVIGNCDFDIEFPNYEIIEIGSCSVLVTHGHLFDVNFSRIQLANFAIKNKCQIVFYGHTHIPRVEKIQGVTLINPGSTNFSRSEHPGSYCVIEIKKTEIISIVFKGFKTNDKLKIGEFWK